VRKYRKKSVEESPVEEQRQAVVLDTPIVVDEPKPVIASVQPYGPPANTSEHGSGGVYRSTGDGRRVRLNS